MNSLRISEKNKINLEIKTLESSIKRNSATIERLSSQAYSDFNKLQIQKLKTQVENDQKNLFQMKEKINLVNSGSYDSYILQQASENMEKSNRIKDENERKLKEKREKKLEEQEKIQQMYATQNKNFNNNNGRGGSSNNGAGKGARGGYNNSNSGGGRGGYNNSNNGGGRGGYNKNNETSESTESQSKGSGILWELLESGGKGSGGREGKY